MLEEYARFYAASTTTSAGFAGLLLVALSVVNKDESQHVTRERRTVLAAGSFLALADIFFVSLVSSLGDTRVLATTSMVMALVGLLGTSRLLQTAIRAGNFARAFPMRNSNLAFVTVAVSIYSIQLILALALLLNSQSAGLTRVTAFVIVALFVSALGRAWWSPVLGSECRAWITDTEPITEALATAWRGRRRGRSGLKSLAEPWLTERFVGH